MSALDAAGIYLILDVNSPLYSLNRDDPGPSYNTEYLQNIFATMDMFSKYDNTLAFFSGNEVINSTAASTLTAPYVKAVTRDMKQYQGDQKQRAIPIGYSGADVASNRLQTAAYLNCGPDVASDFFAFNDYSWCDPSTFDQSGWNIKVQDFSNYSLPIFLSEHGCNTNKRTFGDIAALYNTEMTGVYSGGLVYEYSQEASDYGLVQINSDGSITELSDYTALKTAYAGTSDPSGTGGYRSSPGPSSPCPPSSSDWLVTSEALPAIPDGAVAFMSKGAGPGVGLNGPGSQDAAGASTGTATAGSGQPTATGGSTSAAASSLREFNLVPVFVVVAASLAGSSFLL